MSDSPTINSPSADFASGLHFDFQIKRLPTVSFMITRVNIPGLQVSNPQIATPFKPFPVPGDKMEFGAFRVGFKVDALLQNWTEIYNWMAAIGFPVSYQQRLAAQGHGGNVSTLRSDATLTVCDYHKNPIVNIVYHDLLPSTLSDISYDCTVQNVPYVEAEVNFAYRDYVIEQVKTTY